MDYALLIKVFQEEMYHPKTIVLAGAVIRTLTRQLSLSYSPKIESLLLRVKLLYPYKNFYPIQLSHDYCQDIDGLQEYESDYPNICQSKFTEDSTVFIKTYYAQHFGRSRELDPAKTGMLFIKTQPNSTSWISKNPDRLTNVLSQLAYYSNPMNSSDDYPLPELFRDSIHPNSITIMRKYYEL